MGSLFLIGVLFFGFLGAQFYIRKSLVEAAPKGAVAPLPGRLKPNRWLLARLSPSLYPPDSPLNWHWLKEALWIRVFIARQLWHGASNPAIVLQESPTIIAAYASECDAVLLLRFLPKTIEQMEKRGVNLSPGARLLTVNAYFGRGKAWQYDETVLGPRQNGHWATFRPYLAEFICTNTQTIEKRKSEIDPELWERTRQLGCEKLGDSNVDKVRWGTPKEAGFPRSYQDAIIYARALDIEY